MGATDDVRVAFMHSRLHHPIDLQDWPKLHRLAKLRLCCGVARLDLDWQRVVTRAASIAVVQSAACDA